jgi:RNA-directed DNA polymerase
MNENENSSCAQPHHYDSWRTIPWGKVIFRVSRLQNRIAKAVKQGKWGKAKSLMHLLTKSFDAKLLAVFRVTNNKGRYTPGVDRDVWLNDYDKLIAAENLSSRGYSPKPLKRVYIPKKNGNLPAGKAGKRPLSIPTIHDRAMQALFNMALEPVAETTADPNSYGFRPRRSCADAIAQCFLSLCRKVSAQWIFEADIKSCFDEINHQWILKHIPINKSILQKWLQAGYIENKRLFPTVKGTPQGGIISPAIMNMVLDGLETTLNQNFPRWKGQKVNFIRYADDFIITACSESLIKNEIIPVVKAFLAERGLQLSEEKSKVTHINEGFNFLSQNIRKYNGKLLIRPSKESIQSFKVKLKSILKHNRGIPAHSLIRLLNPVIRGWSNFHKGICAKRAFSKLGTFIFWQLKRWAKYQHGNKNRWWICRRYFTNNHFTDIRNGKKGAIAHRLYRIAYVPIRYHVKVKSNANPFMQEWDTYFFIRRKWREDLAKQCRQITKFAVNDFKTDNSRVPFRRGSLKSA